MRTKKQLSQVDIRVTDPTLGLERIPAGFYAAVQHSGLEWRTESKRSSVNNDVVEWHESIPIPSDLSASVSIAIYAPLGFKPVLGNGEQLRVLNITVEKLLDHSAKDLPFAFIAKEDEDVSPCSSLLVTITQRKKESIDSSGSSVLGPYCPTAEPQELLGDATNQGQSALSRYRKYGRRPDLECAIEQFRHALDICPPDHPCCAAAQSNLAMTTLIHCQLYDTNASLDIPLALYRNALATRPAGHPDRPSTLIQLAAVHMTKFEKRRDEVDAAEGMELLHEALNLSPAECYENLAATIMLHLHTERGEDTASSEDFDEVSASRSANTGPWGLSAYLLRRFGRLGDLADLQHAISILEACVRSMSVQDPLYLSGIANLGTAFRSRFAQFGQLSDLEQAISRQRDAVQLVSNNSPYKSICLSNLGNSLLTRFRRLGELSDLEESISKQREAIQFTPDKPMYLDSLGYSLLDRFERLGDLGDLEDAISSQRDACHLIRHDRHPEKPSYLNNLGNSLFVRFGRLGELTDLDEAISWQRDSVHLSPHGHPEKPSRLHNLGHSLFTRFGRLGDFSDLEEAISRQRDAVQLIPHGHPTKPMILNNLGNSMLARFKHLGNVTDLEEAISKQRDAVRLTPHGHPDMPMLLDGLGCAFSARFDRLGELSDLEEAITNQRNAVDITPDGHPNKPNFLHDLGISFQIRSKHLGELSMLGGALPLFMHAACASTGPIAKRFSASRQWIICAHALGHPSLLDAYSAAIELLPQLAWIGLSITHRYQELIRGADVVREAAAVALNLGRLQTAVEWLEQGRSVVWEGLLQLRSSYDELSSAHPDHALKLRELSAALEHTGVARQQSSSSPLASVQLYNTEHHARESLQQEADRHRRFAIERDKLLQEIRQLPGFEKFLLHKEFSQLRASAHSGPVIILNSAETQCDALIILADREDVMRVPLPGFTHARSKTLQNALGNMLRSARDTFDDDADEEREGQRAERYQFSWASLLSMLWKGIVNPVLKALEFTTAGELSRIFWCPTGHFTFLPLHAAGLYGKQYSEPGHKVSDFVVSSYIPTLSVLLSPPKPNRASTTNYRLLAVKQPPSDGQLQLPGVEAELGHIKVVVQNTSPAEITLVESSLGTVEEVLDLMKDANWVHFACHGVQDAENPTDSGLCLADRRRLRVVDMISLSRPHGGLAFLSACQTAKGDQKLSDEAIHIAAGMLFAGFGGVVGTMWSISDRVAPVVAKRVYEQLFRDCRQGRQPDYREAARALHDAVQRLRVSNASFGDWIPFIHIGL